MARSNAVVNKFWPSEPAQPSARFTSLRTRVLKVETFIRLLDESILHNNSLMSVDDDIGLHDIAIQDIAIQDLSMQSTDVTIQDISMSSVHQNDISMVSAESLMDAENQN